MMRRLSTVLVLALIVALLVRGADSNASAQASCTSPITVLTEADLHDAIGCYNSLASGDLVVEIATDITYTAAMTAIDNPSGAILHVDGADHTLDAATNGSVVTIDAGDVELRTITLTGGRYWDGAGVWNRGTLLVADSVITGNIAEGAVVRGGGISNTGSLIVEGSTISANEARGTSGPASGGGVYSYQGAVTVRDSTISGNIAEAGGSYASGGGITVIEAPVSIVRSAIDENRAATAGAAQGIGGGIAISNWPMEIVASTISRNTADLGGGLWDASGQGLITNSTVSENQASVAGGGIYKADDWVVINHSTITANSSPVGAGIATIGIPSHTLTWLSGSIVADNSGPGFDIELDHDTSDPFISGSFNVIGSTGPNISAFGAGTNDLVDQSSLGLGPLQDNGGPTLTHALVDGSMAVDRVVGTIIVEPPLAEGAVDVDQRGIDRPKGTASDAGAYEGVGLAAALCDGRLVTINLATNGGNGDGTPADDVILGTAAPKRINGFEGDDTICGQGGNDTIRGGTGPDTLSGQGGPDELFGGAGNDTLFGGAETDTCAGNTGNDDTAEAATCESTPGIETLF